LQGNFFHWFCTRVQYDYLLHQVSMILNGSAHVFLNLKKNNNKQSLKIDPGTQKKTGNVKCNKTITLSDSLIFFTHIRKFIWIWPLIRFCLTIKGERIVFLLLYYTIIGCNDVTQTQTESGTEVLQMKAECIYKFAHTELVI
jgi:hypothetical protein